MVKEMEIVATVKDFNFVSSYDVFYGVVVAQWSRTQQTRGLFLLGCYTNITEFWHDGCLATIAPTSQEKDPLT